MAGQVRHLVRRSARTPLVAVTALALGLAACGSGVKPLTAESAHPSLATTATTIDVSLLTLDRAASGQLEEVPIPPGLPALSPGFFYWIDPFGSLWGQGTSPTGASTDVVLNVATGDIRDFGPSLLVGRAAAPGASGMVGERVLAPDGTVVWQARDEGGELAFDSYDVVAMAPGGVPVTIGGTTPDLDGMAFSAPGDGNYLTVAGGRAWWVDGDARVDVSSETGLQQYSSIYSAPLDGSAPQQVTFLGARFPQVDQCAPPRVIRLSYLVDGTSTGRSEQVPEIHTVTLNGEGTVTSDEVLWRADRPMASVNSVGVCGDLVAVGYLLDDPTNTALEYRTYVAITDARGSTVLELSDMTSGAGRVTAVEGGVFFFEWNWSTQIFWSRLTRDPSFIGLGASFGFGAASDGTVLMASEAPDPSAAAGLAYEPRRVRVVTP